MISFYFKISVKNDIDFMKRKFKLVDQYQQKGHLTSLSTNNTTYDVENAGP
jgi:hypothetical protein